MFTGRGTTMRYYTTAALFLVVGCSSPAPIYLPHYKVLGPQVEKTLLATMVDTITPTEQRGVVRMIYARSPCVSINGYSPGILPPSKEPKSGRLVSMDWSTTACINPDPPYRVMSIFVSFRALNTPILGSSNCWLLVNPDHQLFPSSEPGSILTQTGGKLKLRWVPTPDFSGRSVYVQMVDSTPGETANSLMVSPAVEILVGP